MCPARSLRNQFSKAIENVIACLRSIFIGERYGNTARTTLPGGGRNRQPDASRRGIGDRPARTQPVSQTDGRQAGRATHQPFAQGYHAQPCRPGHSGGLAGGDRPPGRSGSEGAANFIGAGRHSDCRLRSVSHLRGPAACTQKFQAAAARCAGRVEGDGKHSAGQCTRTRRDRYRHSLHTGDDFNQATPAGTGPIWPDSCSS